MNELETLQALLQTAEDIKFWLKLYALVVVPFVCLRVLINGVSDK